MDTMATQQYSFDGPVISFLKNKADDMITSNPQPHQKIKSGVLGETESTCCTVQCGAIQFCCAAEMPNLYRSLVGRPTCAPPIWTPTTSQAYRGSSTKTGDPTSSQATSAVRQMLVSNGKGSSRGGSFEGTQTARRMFVSLGRTRSVGCDLYPRMGRVRPAGLSSAMATRKNSRVVNMLSTP